MRGSTWPMLRRHGWRVDKMVHNYVYFLFYYPYVKIVYHTFAFLADYAYWCKPLSPVLRAAFDRYHAKILSFDDTRKMLTLDEDISCVSEQNKRIIPYKYAHKIILSEPDFIAVMDCPCKKTMKAPDWTINSCIAVGKTTARFWIDRCGRKYNARRISQDEALEIVRKFRKAGYLTQAFFKVATGGSTGVVCNCHLDNCVSLQATRFARRFDPSLSMQAEFGYSVKRAADACQNCGTCAKYCMFDAVSHDQQSGWQYDSRSCMGCGLCVEHCPESALALYRDAGRLIPLDLDLIREELSGPIAAAN